MRRAQSLDLDAALQVRASGVDSPMMDVPLRLFCRRMSPGLAACRSHLLGHGLTWALFSALATAQTSPDPLFATEKEQIYLDQGFVLYPARKPRHQDPEFLRQQELDRLAKEASERSQQALQAAVEARVEAENKVKRLEEERVVLEQQATASLREERQLRLAAEAKAMQASLDKTKAEQDLNTKWQAERQARIKAQADLQSLMDQKDKLIQSHQQQLKAEEKKRTDLMSQIKKQAGEESEAEARLSARLVAEEQDRLELQAAVKKLESEKNRLQQELDKLKSDRRSTILISPSGK